LRIITHLIKVATTFLQFSSRPVGISVRNFADATATGMKFTFACPAKVFYNVAAVRQVDVPTFSGTFGILPNHVPVLAVLKPGIVTVFEESGTVQKVFVSSGSVTVNKDSTVQVMAEEACRLEDLDLNAIREGLKNAQQEFGAAKDEEERAVSQISVDTYDALQKAVELGI